MKESVKNIDGLGSVTRLTNSAQVTVASYSYDSFGNSVATGTVVQPYWFTGREYDSESGLMYYRARYYDSQVGRFISKDPIGFAGGDVVISNYVDGNPINFIDPDGLTSVEGFASYYNDMFEGRPTSSGELFSQHLLTGAMHDKDYGMRLPFVVKVESLEDPCKSVKVRVNDRGPFKSGSKGKINRPGYVIDLSSSAYEAVGGSKKKGHIKVRVSW